jgi:hypothetical protein
MLSRSILVLPRLFLGVIFLVAVYPKLTMPPPGFSAALAGFLQHMLPNAHPLYQSFVAILLLLNYMFAKGMSLWTPSSNDAAGRVFGVDRFLAQRWPRIPLW